MEEIRKRRPRRGGVPVVMGALMVLVLVFVGFWVRGNSAPLVVIPPPPTLPNPNAYDFYLRAAQNVARARDVDAAGTPARPGQPPVALAQKQALLALNAQQLADLRAGMAFRYQQPAVRTLAQDSQFSRQQVHGKFRTLARLLVLEGQVREAKGDAAGAAQSYLDAVKLGEDIPRGGSTIARLVGLACQSVGRAPLWQMADRLDGPAARRAAHRLEAIAANHPPLADTLTEEKYYTQSNALLLLHNPVAVSQQVSNPGGGANLVGTWLGGLLSIAYPKRKVMRDLTAYMDAQIAAARAPYGTPQKPVPVPTDPISRTLLPGFLNLRTKDTEAGPTQNALLATTLALRAYRADHKKYPAALAALVPGYLLRVPNDPFARLPNTPLRYKPASDSKTATLYSVGPDGKDDNGKPIVNPRGTRARNNPANKNARFYVERDSTGDVVAGINRW